MRPNMLATKHVHKRRMAYEHSPHFQHVVSYFIGLGQLPRVLICLEEIGRTRFTQHQTKVMQLVALFSLFAHFVACLWCAQRRARHSFTRGVGSDARH